MLAALLRRTRLTNPAAFGGSGGPGFEYLRPGGADYYLRPGGTDFYQRP